ncbi:ABC transporter substrate-binding protein [Acetivibrio thermocellus]|jgi:ABC-type uncharacterized transport system substrate-binding protein|nr:ABC transporter substrate binding protein [Acetivibrio thermocellus]UWV48384.1 hypothetical protein N1236_07690 [Acetivibrio thermocellus]
MNKKMKMAFSNKWKCALLFAVTLSLIFTAACASKPKAETITPNQESQKNTSNLDSEKEVIQTEQGQENSGQTNRLDNTGKKIAFVTFANPDSQEWQKLAENAAFRVLKEAGYDTENTEFKIIKEDDATKVGEVTKEIMQFSPDLALVINSSIAIPLAKSLEGAPFPVVIPSCREAGVIDSSGVAAKNVTGVNFTPVDILAKAANLVSVVDPSIPKKTVFIIGKYAPAKYPKEMVESQLKAAGVELKAYEVPETEEELYSVIEKYENDPEIKWVIYVGNFVRLKDGTVGNLTDALTYLRENSKKINIALVDSMVKYGAFGGVTVDLTALAEQQTEIAVRLLNGEDIKSIKIEDPKKVYIYYNKMTADRIGVELPLQAIESAYRVYTDYEGNYIGN